jgi:predicted nuclease of restriction endonuclease-like (RecB) superfamily
MAKLTRSQSVQGNEFRDVLSLIEAGRSRAYHAVNASLINTYWQVGGYLSQKVQQAQWGRGVVQDLATWLAQQQPGLKGFSASNLWRMMQFFDTYATQEELAPLVREIDWSKHLILLGRCKTPEERSFYLLACHRANWSRRELERQIDTGAFERTVLADEKLAPALREFPAPVAGTFKDSYLLDFLNLPDRYLEADLQSALIANLRRFLLELGHGFTFVGEKIRVQVGNRDFELDLLFYHRDLRCLVAFELKTGQFEPEHLGQLSFYLEALDRDHRRPGENPSIGVLLCQRKDDEVVEYALSRHLSPTLVAEYETRLLPKELLRQKLHEWRVMLERSEGESE